MAWGEMGEGDKGSFAIEIDFSGVHDLWGGGVREVHDGGVFVRKPSSGFI